MKKFLLLDTTREPAQVVIATARSVIAETQVAGRHELSERLLARVDELTESSEISLSDISAIGIVTGPGPFTALRIGASVANALAYAQGIPIVELTGDEAKSLQTFAELTAERLEAGQTVPAVLPNYGREPSITLPGKQ
jgi:tRNA threonylcarbamoyladenosine biosynthesis protein TsaB